MKTSNYHDPLLLNFKNNPIRETPNARTTPVTVYGGKTPRTFTYALHSGGDCGDESVAKR
jgi:hypothetical protein